MFGSACNEAMPTTGFGMKLVPPVGRGTAIIVGQDDSIPWPFVFRLVLSIGSRQGLLDGVMSSSRQQPLSDG